MDTLDHHDLDSLENEYTELAIADLTDDVTCDINAAQARDVRMEEITKLVGESIANAWFNAAEVRAKEIGYASGKALDI